VEERASSAKTRFDELFVIYFRRAADTGEEEFDPALMGIMAMI
jgi:hypothetical protein